jgi:hypothetical protein
VNFLNIKAASPEEGCKGSTCMQLPAMLYRPHRPILS